MGSTATGKVNFKKFKKVPRASMLKQMANNVTSVSSTSTNISKMAPITNTTRNPRLKKPKLESSQFISFKDEPFDVDSQFLSFMSQNR